MLTKTAFLMLSVEYRTPIMMSFFGDITGGRAKSIKNAAGASPPYSRAPAGGLSALCEKETHGDPHLIF